MSTFNDTPILGPRLQEIHQWNLSMGWNSKSTLESMGLVYSEVGECFEVFHNADLLPGELADIVIRCANIAEGLSFNLDEATAKAAVRPKHLMVSPFDTMAYVTIALKECVNACRKGTIEPQFSEYLGEAVFMVYQICEMKKIDILKAIDAKMVVNKARGSRGRTV